MPTSSSSIAVAGRMMQDFGEQYLYADLDARLAPPAPGEKRVVFLGDSITDLWNLAAYFPSRPYVNRGIGGQVTPQLVARFHADVIALKPSAVVILAGVNDVQDVLQVEKRPLRRVGQHVDHQEHDTDTALVALTSRVRPLPLDEPALVDRAIGCDAVVIRDVINPPELLLPVAPVLLQVILTHQLPQPAVLFPH